MLTINPEAVEQFRFKVGEVEYAIPTMEGLPLPLLRKYVKDQGDASEVGLDLMQEVLDKYAPGLTDTLPASALVQVFAAYVAEAKERGADVGESSASSD